MRRALALVAAVAMVVGAVLVRGGGLGGDDGGDDAVGSDVSSIRVVCTTELAAACERLAEADDRVAVSVSAAGDVTGRLAAGDLAADVWLTAGPWAAMAGELGPRDVLGEPSGVLARSPLVVVGFPGTVPDCGGQVTWRCLGDAGLRLGIEGLDRTAGLFALGQAGTSFFGGEDYASNDFEVVPDAGGPAFGDWAARLLASVPRSALGTPLEDVLRTGSATYDVAASVEAVAGPAAARSRREPVPTVLYPAPMATVDVVAVPVLGGDANAAAAGMDLLAGDRGRAALAEAGWRVEGEALVEGLDPAVVLPEGDGLPSAGVLAALRARA